MRNWKIWLGVGAVCFVVSTVMDDEGSDGFSSGDPDFYGIMDRMVYVAEAFDQMVVEGGFETAEAAETEELPVQLTEGMVMADAAPAATPSADDEVMVMFTDLFEQAINTEPALYKDPMGVTYEEDGSFEGYRDANGDGERSISEGLLFTLEIDEENNRLVCTDETGRAYGFSGIGTGFFAGAMAANFLGRQRMSGVNPSRFANTSVSNRSASSVRSARSSARSGGARSGK